MITRSLARFAREAAITAYTSKYRFSVFMLKQHFHGLQLSNLYLKTNVLDNKSILWTNVSELTQNSFQIFF